MNEEPKARDHIFYIEVAKIHPNPYQPRKEFSEDALKSLASSIREYGILQPLVVTRAEKETETGTVVEYELIAGERRWRASQLAGLTEVPAVIRRQESAKVKLELALIENVQREDLNPIERAIAYQQLIDEFGLSQRQVAERIGKSREVVANTLRLLNLPDLFQQSLVAGDIFEGHARPLLMLTDYPDEQEKLFHDILEKKLSVREAEERSREIAIERSTKYKKPVDPEIKAVEEKLSGSLGARVQIVKDKSGKGRISIEFFSNEELQGIARRFSTEEVEAIAEIASTPTLDEPVDNMAIENTEKQDEKKEGGSSPTKHSGDWLDAFTL